MKDEPREPINVFAVNERMDRVTGSVPYTSLRWVRRYNKPGEFEMVVPANIYDPSWAYIVCYDRPETGIVQKVEFTDSSQVYGGIDSITVSGFFLESILNSIVFLQESPEQQKVYVPMPRRPVGRPSSSPDVYQDPSGGYWVQLSTGQWRDDNGTVMDSLNTSDLTKVDYNGAYADNDWGTDLAYMNYDYYSEDGETINRVNMSGGTTSYDIEFTDDRGNVFFKDLSGKLTQAAGVVEKRSDTYTIRKKSWNALPDDDPYGRYCTVTVKGPWQRTEMMEPVTAGDSIDIVMRWARRMMGDWIVYEEPTIDGMQKAVDPSFQYLGDLLYATLAEVGASLRLEYVFESNAYVLSVYRGNDRTQGQEEVASSRAKSALASPVPLSSSIPAGYTMLEYIEGSGSSALYSPGQSYTLGDSDSAMYAQWAAVEDSLVYYPNAEDFTGQTPATGGGVGQQVVVAQCGFTRDRWSFVGWNTSSDGSGDAYAPGDMFTLTEGRDVLYAQWEYSVPGGKMPWAVFSDTWGTISGYSASRDASNYRNTCFVLYEYDVPNSFDANGWPHAGPIYAIDDTYRASLYGIAYTSKRGYNTEHVGDDSEPAIETYLDLRNEKPSCDGDWSREVTQLDTSSDSAYQESLEAAAAKYAYTGDGSPDLESIYAAYEAAIPGRGEAHLKENYSVETQLDTGTVKTNGYLRDFDLGDLVEMAVSTVGLATKARIIEVEEVYTSGSVEIHLTIGDEKLTSIRKARLA